jgi:hypothetical protein
VAQARPDIDGDAGTSNHRADQSAIETLHRQMASGSRQLA